MDTTGGIRREHLTGEAADLLYESASSVVVRLRLSDGGGSVVCKLPLGHGATGRVRHERAILRRMAGIVGVVQVSDLPSSPEVIVLADAGATPLEAEISDGPMDVAKLLDLAPGLAEATSAMHNLGVIHRDITPGNVVWDRDSCRVWLTDFDLATTFTVERPTFRHQNDITGTLAYLAPEQTGHTGHPVDQRADLYGIGTTLYALATGAPPFGFADPLQLVHDHLARVPIPPAQLNPAVPAALSEIIMRLLEKEPDRRYQSAEGLAHDLRLARDAWLRGESGPRVLAERDFPLQLTAPSRIIGRETEIAALERSLADALAGRRRGLLISGAPGVGKTRLLDQLRPMVATRGGWFVSGKFDQYRQDEDCDAVLQALRGLGQLLLAEPEAQIVEQRRRLLACLGGNAGLAAAVLPEFATLLQVAPQPPTGDPASVQARLQGVGLALLRSIASQQRPVVIAVDDLQWATPTTLGFVDAVLLDGDLRGVLLVGAYRKAEVDETHPLAAMLDRWQRLGAAPSALHLVNLAPAALGSLLADMLRIDAAQAVPLAEAIAARTDGNPYDTVELVNALRRDGVLTVDRDGWSWDAGELHRHIGDGDVIDLLNARMQALPAETRADCEIMSCLGGAVELTLLATACGCGVEGLTARLLPALEDGLLVMDAGGEHVGFRHDRVQQAALAQLTAKGNTELRLAIARRLADIADFAGYAGEQYLQAIEVVTDRTELRRAAQLFHQAATGARTVANHGRAERFVAAALEVLAPGGVVGEPQDVSTVVKLAIERHSALYSLGRLPEADEVYLWIGELTPDPVQVAAAGYTQVGSLTSRGMLKEAVAVGIDLLERLGKPVPQDPETLGAEIGAGLEALYRWIGQGDEHTDLARPVCSDRRVLAIGQIVNKMIPPAFFSGQPVMAWLMLEAARMWDGYGPAQALVGPLSHAAFVTIPLREDYRTGYAVVRRVLAVSKARGYEPDTSQCRLTYGLSSAPWFEPLDEVVAGARAAHEGLIQGGELYFAGNTWFVLLPDLVDCAATVDEVLTEAEAAMAFCARTGNDQAAQTYLAYRQFARAMLGQTSGPGSFDDDTFDDAAHQAQLGANPSAAANYHVMRAIVAALYGDRPGLLRHAAAVGQHMPFITAIYLTAPGHLVQALALAEQIRAVDGAAPETAEADALLAEFEAHRDWLARRAEDAPGSFRHLVVLLRAELAWAKNDFKAAAAAFDAAASEAAPRRRPWHQALIAERAALFHLDHGLERVGHQLMAEARLAYQQWGAVGKVAELDRQYPILKAARAPVYCDISSGRSIDTTRSGVFASESIDMLAVLRASLALSSETNLDGLRNRVVSVLSAMTGATTVRVVLHMDEDGWLLPGDDHPPIPVEQAAERGLVPLSAFRYAERTKVPLLVEDAVRDDRFVRDRYFTGVDRSSLLVVPILNRGEPRAMLILENRLSRTAFTQECLGAVMMIAGQLAVSLENALLYSSLERKVAQRTEELDAANQRLTTLSVTDALTGLANRRRLEDVLDHEWQQARRAHVPVTFVMIDIDHFKLYNDHYGHPSGDRCLRRVSAVIAEQVRSTDLVARYGGEEFAIVMPGPDLHMARQIANRIREAVVELEQPHEHSPEGVVTVSIGVATTVPDGTNNQQQLIKAADANLYHAKNNGRNQVSTS